MMYLILLSSWNYSTSYILRFRDKTKTDKIIVQISSKEGAGVCMPFGENFLLFGNSVYVLFVTAKQLVVF